MSHHLPQWAQEMSPTYRGPTTAGTLALLAVVALVLLALLSGPQATADGAGGKAPASTVPACARHWPPTCQQPGGGR
jgi:hypothetical protein